jgi:hypothetical protein
MSTIGQNHICTYGVYTVFLVEKLPNIRSYTVHIHAYGQQCIYARFWPTVYIYTLLANDAYTHAYGQRCIYTRFWPTLARRAGVGCC